MKCPRLLFILLLPVILLKSPEVSAEWQKTDLHGPSQVGITDSLAIDVNADGLLDVVSASYDDGTVRAYLNQGRLRFKEQLLSSGMVGAFRLSSADINNDGRPDFLVPSVETSEVYLLLSQQGTYQKQRVTDQVPVPTDAVFVDLNGDGVDEIITASFSDDLLMLHERQPTGGYDARLLADGIISPRKLLSGDFNGDLRPDLMVASTGDDSLRLLVNEGQMTFTVQLISDTLSAIRYVTHCRLNDDEWPDVVAVASGVDEVRGYLNNGSGFTETLIDDDLSLGSALHCQDVDADGTAELFALSSQNGVIYRYELDNGVSRSPVASNRDGYVSLTTGDFNNDGSQWLLTQSFFEHRNLLYMPHANNQEVVVWESFPYGAFQVNPADLDNDGDQDLVYVAFREDNVYWAEQHSGGYEVRELFSGVEGPQSILTDDIDQDGDVDVFSAGAWDDTFWFHENLGAGGFASEVIFAQANNASSLVAGDFTGDGRRELIGTSSLDDSVRMFTLVDQVFKPVLIAADVDGAQSLAAADFDGDGDLDFVVGAFFGNRIHLFTNDGTGRFSQQVIAQGHTKPYSLHAFDVDGDLDQDVVFAATQDRAVWWLENQPSGFVTRLVLSSRDVVRTVVPFDYDFDQDLDLVITLRGEGTVLVSINSAGTWAPPSVVFENQFGARFVNASADRKSQLLLANDVNNSIAILERSDLIFTASF